MAFSPTRLVLSGLCFALIPLTAQAPRIAAIDFYGLHKVSQEKLRKALGASEGSPLPASKGALEEKLDEVSGVVASHVEAVCCEGDGVLLFVGIEERGSAHFAPRSEPTGDAVLPESILEAYGRFTESARGVARDGQPAEDLTKGHSLVADPVVRATQERFVGLAELHIDELRKVLRESADEEQRVVGAFVIGYFPTKRLVVDDLQLAMQDPSPAVRANAMRALGAISVLALRDPEMDIKVQPTWFVELLNSVIWSDRIKAVATLLNLTDSRDERILIAIRDRGLDSLVEMARWKSLRHAIGPFTLIGRMAGLKEEAIQKAWTAGEREQVIVKYLKDSKEQRKKRDYGPPPLPPDYQRLPTALPQRP